MAELQNSTANSGGGSYMSELLGESESFPAESSTTSTDVAVEQDTDQSSSLIEAEAGQSDVVTQDEDASQQGDDAYVQKRINELARSKGVDPNDPKVRELLREIALVEQRKSHADAHIKRLETQATEEWITEFEKSLGKEQQTQLEPKREQRAAEQPPPQQMQGDRFNDIGTRNGWRTPEDAYRDELAAYGDGSQAPDLRQLHDIRTAQFIRQFDAFALPAIMDILERRFGTFEKEKLADIVPVVQQTQQAQIADRSMERARAEIAKVGGEVFAEIMKPDQDGFVEYEGKRLPNSPFNRIMKEFPEYLERIDTTAPETEQIKQYINVYRFAMKMHARSKQNGLTPQKAKQIMQAGMEQKARQDTQHRARAAMNAGGSRGPGANSKGGYVDELTAPTGRQSLADVMRRR